MGSRYRRKSDGLWVASISTGGRGNRVKTVRYAKTRKEADALLDDLRKLARPAAGSGRTTVGQYLRSWLDTAGKRSLKASTWRTYDVALRLHIDPAIGTVTLARLTAEHVDTMLAASELEPKGQRNVLGFLGRVLDVALARGHVLRNAARLVEPPRGGGEEQAVLSEAEARRILVAVRGDRLEALWVMALGSGLRQGELLGLRWEDVDLDAATVTVEYALARQDGEYVLDEPKTKRSRRVMGLPAFAVTALRAHRLRQLEELMAVGKASEGGMVFYSPDGNYLNGGWVSHRWRRLSRAVGVDVTFHGLRGTNATILSDRDVPEHVRMARLGHTVKATHRRYAHATEAPDRAAAAALDEALGG